MIAHTLMEQDAKPWRHSFLAIILFAGALVLYFITLSNNNSMDSMSFALMTTKGEVGQPLFFQAEHLLYPAIGWLWYKLWLLLGYGQGALKPLQALNAIFGAAGVSFFYLCLTSILGRTSKGLTLSFLGALGLAFSYGYWFHSTDAEDQIISNVLLLLSFSILLLMMRRRTTQKRWLLLASLAFSFAVLCHATNILFLPVGLLLAWSPRGLGRQESPRATFGERPRKDWRGSAGFLAIAFAVIAISYLLVGFIAHDFRSIGDYRGWFLSAPAAGVWGRPGIGNVWQGVKTAVNAIVYLSGGPNFRSLLGGRATWLEVFGIFIFTIVIAAIIGVILYYFYRRQRISDFKVVLACLLWIAIYGIFNLYWAPEDIQFWVITVPPVLVLAGVVVHNLISNPVRAGVAAIGACVVCALLVINLSLAMAPRSDLSKNQGYAKAMCLGQQTQPNDLIITPGWDWVSGYAPYFAERQVFSISDAYLLEACKDRGTLFKTIESRIDVTRDRGGKVYLVRLYNLSESEQEWFKRVTGLQPDDFDLNLRRSGDCLGEPVWEIVDR